MKKVAILLLSGAAALLISTTAALAATVTGSAVQHEIDRSGIQGRIDFVDTGSALTVLGTATGLDPNKKYFSLIYNAGLPGQPGSVPGGRPEAEQGAAPCEPTINPPNPGSLTFPQMFVGFWNSSAGTLSATKTGASYAALGTFSTISIRQVLDPTKPPSEENQVLVACGEVHVNR